MIADGDEHISHAVDQMGYRPDGYSERNVGAQQQQNRGGAGSFLALTDRLGGPLAKVANFSAPKTLGSRWNQ